MSEGVTSRGSSPEDRRRGRVGLCLPLRLIAGMGLLPEEMEQEAKLSSYRHQLIRLNRWEIVRRRQSGRTVRKPPSRSTGLVIQSRSASRGIERVWPNIRSLSMALDLSRERSCPKETSCPISTTPIIQPSDRAVTC